jgi:Gas vesicle synthesis protein GvpL/GvpF
MTQSTVRTDYIYVYGLTYLEDWKDRKLPAATGIDQKKISTMKHEDLLAIITSVHPNDFSQEQLDVNMKNTEWLKANAFHHHECISELYQYAAILPMPFGTIFKNEENLINFMGRNGQLFQQSLSTIKGKQEWNLKLFCDQEAFLTFTLTHDLDILECKEKIKTMPAGRQFLFKKKLEHLLASKAESLQSEWWDEIHQQLNRFVSDSHLRQNWSKEVTERKEVMIANCDYLIPNDCVDGFINQVKDLENKYKDSGCLFQISGPWPPYHFSKIQKEIT